MNLYHGTSSELNIKNLLPPIQSNILREEFRVKNLDYIYATDSLKSAISYAWKSVEKFGGKPVVYTITPIGDCIEINQHEYIINECKIINKDII